MASSKHTLGKLVQSFSDDDEEISFHRPLFEISTGSYALNDALSTDGLRGGRIIQYYGPSASGKTLMSMLAIKEAQKLNPDAYQVYIDAEDTFDHNWAKKIGVFVDDEKGSHNHGVYLVAKEQAVYAERAFELLIGRSKKDAATGLFAGKEKDGILDLVAAGEMNVNLIVLDSLGQLIFPIEATTQVGKQNMSAGARFLTTEMKKLSLAVSKANIPMIIINHKRDNMDKYGPDHSYAGGNAYSHALSATIYFRQKGAKDEQIFEDEKKTRKIGANIMATVEKSKFGPHPRTAEFKLHFEKGIIDPHEEISDLGIQYGVIQRLNNITYSFNGEEIKTISGLYEYFKAEDKQKLLWSKICEARNKSLQEVTTVAAEPEPQLEGVLGALSKRKPKKVEEKKEEKTDE